jgi:hypothetical protein
MSIDWENLATAQQQIIERLQRELRDRNTPNIEETLATALSAHVATLRQIDASANGRLVSNTS